jgi:serine/threonine-protein kinase
MSDEKTATRDDVPATIGRYQVTGTLGFGAMGAVYKAFDPLIKRTLAIKTIRLDIPRQSPQHRAFIERFYQEARISGTLSHPSIVTLFDIGDEDGVPFLAMEFVDGQTIGAVLEAGTRFDPEKVIGLVSQVAAALDYAHSRGVVHRDIKPSNLIVHERDKVKVTDFGIAKLADSEMTHSGVLLGTPSYMSPEQAMGEKLDGRSDIFSLGVVSFEMLSGHQPFPGANVTSILYKLVHVDPIEPADLEMNGLVPQKWREVFHKVLAKKPENRYQTASAFVQDLEYCLGSWFTGLGNEETVSLQMPAPGEATVTLPGIPAPIPSAPPGSAAPSGEETLVLAPPGRGESGPGSARPALDGPGVTLALETPAADEETVRQAAVPSLEDLVPATVVMTPVEASRTLSLAPTLRDASASIPPPRAPRAGVPLRWALGGAAAAAAVALGVASWAFWHRSAAGRAGDVPAPSEASSPAAALPTPVPVPRGALRVESEPAGARVRVNGEVRGDTPLALADLPLGAYSVRVERKGYDPQSRDVTLSDGSPSAEVRVALVRSAAAEPATADIQSTPPGASVSVDGRPAGETPLSGLKLKPGRHQVTLALDGHEPWSGTVDVAAGEKGRVAATLRPVAKPPAPPTPEPVDTARVYDNAAGAVDTLARKVSGSSPSYPSRAGRLRSGERVSVVVRILVTEAGDVQEVTVVESGGKAVDEVVASAVRTWRYEPATKRGVRVKVQTLFKQTFLGG